MLDSSQESGGRLDNALSYLRQRLDTGSNQSSFIDNQLKKFGFNNQPTRPPVIAIPEQFDARRQWPSCPSIGKVHNQGCCSSDYAFAVTSMLTDRSCTYSNGSVTRTFSAYDPLTCCDDCVLFRKDPCAGGYVSKVLQYARKVGIVEEDCLPYSPGSICSGDDLTCPRMCKTVGKYVADNRRTATKVIALDAVVNNIKYEIMENGPVVASFKLCEDYLKYGSGEGVYVGKAERCVGIHNFKVIGWGQEEGMDYWLAVDSLGEDWGKSGAVKFRMNQLEVEKHMYAVVPKI
ncbi:cathepsin B-like [Ochlerotatus camptorhynchus]|uniref:cathepsin B-like n=1 Tax=Ochlerotatus camptorhynchus TaxID=644619 RepID=UPI0031DE4640